MPYLKASYRFGTNYVSRIAGHENVNSVKDDHQIRILHKTLFDNFARKINSLIKMQMTENRRDYQIIAGEKERIASELSSEISWRSYNQGVKSKGSELTLKKVPTSGLIYMDRKIRTPNLKQLYNQKIFVNRVQTQEAKRERTQAATSPEEAAVSFVFITQHDELVCEICRGFEFQSWALADPDIPDIPDETHPNCRCILMVAEDTDEGSEELRRMILEETAFTSATLSTLISISGGAEDPTLAGLRKARAAQKKKKKKKR